MWKVDGINADARKAYERKADVREADETGLMKEG